MGTLVLRGKLSSKYHLTDKSYYKSNKTEISKKISKIIKLTIIVIMH